MTNLKEQNAITVTVVIPMYNVENYIVKALTSVLNQTYSQFEVLCVDDGCTDATIQKVSAFRDKRITIISQLNRGLSGARNTGISAAKGRYVALLDADDYWAPDKLKLHVQHLENNPSVDVSYSPSLFIDEQGELLGIGQFPKLTNVSAKDIFCRNPVGNGSSPVIRTSILKQAAKVNLTLHHGRKTYFNESLRQSEDIEFWLRLSLTHNAKFEGLSTPLTFYRVNSEGLSANLSRQLKSWRAAVQMNRIKNQTFFYKWQSLAEAYQLRYLARRAVQSGDAGLALKFCYQAIQQNFRILIEEPCRTVTTFMCALLSLLPAKIYKRLEEGTMKMISYQPR